MNRVEEDSTCLGMCQHARAAKIRVNVLLGRATARLPTGRSEASTHPPAHLRSLCLVHPNRGVVWMVAQVLHMPHLHRTEHTRVGVWGGKQGGEASGGGGSQTQLHPQASGGGCLWVASCPFKNSWQGFRDRLTSQ